MHGLLQLLLLDCCYILCCCGCYYGLDERKYWEMVVADGGRRTAKNKCQRFAKKFGARGKTGRLASCLRVHHFAASNRWTSPDAYLAYDTLSGLVDCELRPFPGLSLLCLVSRTGGGRLLSVSSSHGSIWICELRLDGSAGLAAGQPRLRERGWGDGWVGGEGGGGGLT